MMKRYALRGGVRLLVPLLLLALALPLGPATTARAAGTTFYVGTLIDSAALTPNCRVATNTTCTLRSALALAANGDTIQFDANAAFGTYVLGTAAGEGTLTIAQSVTIVGPGADKVAIDGGLNAATHSLGTLVFLVNAGVTATISGLEITHGNNQSIGGGGIYSLGTLTLINDVVDHNNTIDIGGGVDSAGGSSITVTGCSFIGNTAGGFGGGLSVTSGSGTITNSTFSMNSTAYLAGGIYFGDAVPSTVTNSTISTNSATGDGGGGIYIFNGYITLTNDTIVGNGAVAPGGGGIYDGGESLTIIGSTIAMNKVNASGAGGGILSAGYGPVAVSDSLITGNGAGNCAVGGPNGGISDGGHNLQFGDASCGGTIPVSDPLLDPGGLKDNGGPTQTIALLPGSPAIDAVPASGAKCPAIDERGAARPQPAGGACDSGAYEYSPVRPTVSGTYTVGAAGQTVRLTGTGFQRGSQVVVDGTPLPGSAVTNVAADGAALTVALPGHAAATVTLAVVNPGGLTSAATGNLTYRAPNPLPPAQPTPASGATPPASLPAPRATGSPASGTSGGGNLAPLPARR